MKKIIKAGLLAAILLWTNIGWSAEIANLRTSISPSKVRIVLDSKGALEYKDSLSDKVLNIEITNGQAKNIKAPLKDKLVQNVELKPVGKKSLLTVNLSKHNSYKIFRLKNPDRLVIDFPKIVISRQDKQVAKGVSYSYIQDDFENRQIQVHVIEVLPDAPFEWRPFSAAGTYNGRGSLAARAASLKLPVAVNASYFDRDGWVIGTTKDRGRIMSMESTPHSAFLVKNGKCSILKDVTYTGKARLADGTLLEVKGMNRLRIAEDLVVYNEYFAPSTKTNHWGREVKVNLKNNRILAVSTLGDMTIEPGTIVLSGHGQAAAILAKCRMGDQLVFKEELNSSAATQAETLIGAGPMLVEKGLVNVRTTEENIAKDIAYGRAPRTAVGVKEDGTTLVIVVDGRNEDTAGMSLPELARYLIKLGVVEAVNFDGGGSSEMCLNGKIVNRPSDGRERAISIGMGLFPQR